MLAHALGDTMTRDAITAPAIVVTVDCVLPNVSAQSLCEESAKALMIGTLGDSGGYEFQPIVSGVEHIAKQVIQSLEVWLARVGLDGSE